MNINSAFRLRAIKIISGWFENFDTSEQNEYVRNHPNSKYARKIKELEQKKLKHSKNEVVVDNKSAEQLIKNKEDDVDNLKTAINDLIDHIKVIESIGNSSENERKVLKNYRDDLNILNKVIK